MKNCIRKTKKAYYNRLFLKNKNNLANTWKILKNIISYKIDNFTVKRLIWDNTEIFDDSEIAEVFISYFSSIATNLDHEQASLNHWKIVCF